VYFCKLLQAPDNFKLLILWIELLTGDILILVKLIFIFFGGRALIIVIAKKISLADKNQRKESKHQPGVNNTKFKPGGIELYISL